MIRNLKSSDYSDKKHTDTAHKSTAKRTRYAAIKRKLKAALCRSKYIIDMERSDAAPV